MTNKDSEAQHIEEAGDKPHFAVSNEGEKGVSVQQWTEEEEKALVRAIDWRVFPMLCIVFALSLLDRTNISAAYIAGLGEDIQLLQGSRYNIALLVFFIGYGLFEIPSNLVIRRVGARIWLSFLITSWGACVLGMGFVRSWTTLTVCRALLGIFEAGLFPGAVFIIGSWYRQYETATRVSLFYMAALTASGFGPILAYAFSLIRVGDGIYAQGWRWIFIIEGIATIVAGIAAAFFLVQFPDKASWLKPRQKEIAIARLSIDKQSREYKHPSLKEAFVMMRDWKLIVYSIQYFIAASGVYSIAYFQPIILRDGMGFSYALSQILSSPPYIFAIIMSLLMAWLSDKYKIRWLVLVIQALFAVVGLLITLYCRPPGVRYFGLFFAVFGTQANVPSTLSYGQSQVATVEKRGVIAAAMISVGAAGGITGSTIFRTQDAPTYLPGMWATIAMQMLYILVTLGFSFYLNRQNRLVEEGKRDALEGVEGFRYAP
ncbi:uncharacterized protein N7479_007199 [Penicillium vulpinum]|uniref:Major facilitator superfamily (MFS) profile domain-containing protein n=1 Tax=Penicillium vulpinum TaxID=29845 RepID=A0A1V6S091_9EURO|nr:uncharacterized protein N7479_007199 [Penicillium vulpinum]KAJ5960049.1 hypothetical protein N7479_007199 [Penicillium vulpinum]OQE07447.1 hypothetical protein PENVUL_c013G00578 [Penicillium vulpinum]